MDFNHGMLQLLQFRHPSTPNKDLGYLKMLPTHTTTLNDKYLEFLDITERQLHNT